MRRLVIWMQMSLDGYASGPDGAFDWPVVTDELTEHWQEIGEEVDTFLYGRNVWGFMSQFWPTADAIPDASTFQKAHAAKWREVPKYVFSRTLDQAAWDATIIRDDIVGQVNELKRQPGGALAMFGGPQTASRLIELGLVDEYRLFIHPVAVGGGARLFPTAHDRTRLELLEARPFSNAVVATHYRTAS